MTIKDKLVGIIGILSIPFAVSCGMTYVCGDGTEPIQTPMESDVCMYDNHVDLDEIDHHFFDVEQKLGYEDTPRNVWIEIVPAKLCQKNDSTSVYCFEELGFKYNGYFLPDNLIKIHNGNDTLPLENTALRFEFNRYLKYQNGSSDWDCEEYEKAKPNCFNKYIE